MVLDLGPGVLALGLVAPDLGLVVQVLGLVVQELDLEEQEELVLVELLCQEEFQCCHRLELLG